VRFHPVTVAQILDEIQELPSDAPDHRGADVTAAIPFCIDDARTLLPGPIEEADVERLLRDHAYFLDFSRLVLGVSQDAFATQASEILIEQGHPRVDWKQLEALRRKHPTRLAQVLMALDFGPRLAALLNRTWTLADVLEDRYRQGRGRAVSGIRRGSLLEKEVSTLLLRALDGRTAPFDSGVTYTGFKGLEAKCDFAIPGKDRPKIVIECKGFEATGSKLTDVLGDVRKIIEAKAPHTYFFVVTDGRGWRRRTGDLEKLVAFQREGSIDMIFTRARLSELQDCVRQILTLESNY